ncbi:MAG: dimethylarginine dimethylaminohydrolase family protein [Candidatus Neomarinimicrobiota bacterium]
MINYYGCQSMVNPIRRVLIKHAKEGFKNQSELNQSASKLNYLETPNFSKSISDYDQFVKLLKSFDIEIHYLPNNNNTTPDSIYTHDPCIVSNKGVILCSMGKDDRRSEVPAVESYFKSLDIPILGKIKKPGNLEGGDVVWINERSVAVGEGYRSNSEGIKQLKDLLSDLVDNVISVPLPHWTGPLDCLHLMSLLSPIDKDLFLVYSRLLPVPFLKYLSLLKIKLIHIPDNEYDSMGCNVLAVAPKKVIMLEGNPETKKMLEKNKVEVFCYDGSEISLKGAGGPTCLTRPFLRQ